MAAVLVTRLLLVTSVRESLQQTAEPVTASSVGSQTISVIQSPDRTTQPSSNFSSTDEISLTNASSSVTDEVNQASILTSRATNANHFPTEPSLEETESVSFPDDTDPFEIYPTALNIASGTDILTAFAAAVLDVEESCAASIVFDEGYAAKASDIARHLSTKKRGFSVQVSRLTGATFVGSFVAEKMNVLSNKHSNDDCIYSTLPDSLSRCCDFLA